MKFVLWLGLLVSNLANAGGISSSGGDNFPADANSAWFLGDKEIRYCFVVSDDFGVSREEISQAIEFSAQKWRDYIAEKRINDTDYTRNPIYDELRDKKLLFQTKAMASCDGTEDLKFLFGVLTPEVQKHISEYYNPTAFAIRESYDAMKGWGKGFIWFRRVIDDRNQEPIWKKEFRLHAMLLHEIGHILGVDHIEDTIMDKTMGEIVWWSSLTGEKAKNYFTSIDNQREVYVCQGCEYTFESSEDDEAMQNSFKKGFERLVGKKPSGSVRMRFESRGEKWFHKDRTLHIWDDKNNFSFPLDADYSPIGMFMGDASVFKKAVAFRSDRPDMLKEGSLHSTGYVEQVFLNPLNGPRISLILSRNTTMNPFTLQFIGDSSLNSDLLFVAKVYYPWMDWKRHMVTVNGVKKARKR
jgi:hypothetical protein